MHESDEFVGIWIAGHHQQLLRPRQQDLHFPLRQDLHLLLKHGLQFNVHEGGNKCKQGGKASKQQDLHFPKEALPASPKYINCLCAITRSHWLSWWYYVIIMFLCMQCTLRMYWPKKDKFERPIHRWGYILPEWQLKLGIKGRREGRGYRDSSASKKSHMLIDRSLGLVKNIYIQLYTCTYS